MRECKKCIAYQLHHNLLKPMYCKECGETTLNWRQSEYGTFYAECSNCSGIIAVDLNTPCELDPLFEQENRVVVNSLAEPISRQVILDLSKLLHVNVVQMKRMLNYGFSMEVSTERIIEIMELLENNEIQYYVDSPENPLEKYPYFEKCRYPYSAMRNYLGVE